MKRIVSSNNLEVLNKASLEYLGGSGTRMVTVDNNGDVSAQAIPAGGGTEGLGDPGSNGFVVRTGLNTTASRSLIGEANRIVITSTDGSGNPTFTIGSDVVTLDSTQTLTNKTFTNPKINVGSDSSGDMYYRNSSGNLVRLPPGPQGYFLSMGASSVPSWVTAPTGGGGTSGLTAAYTQMTDGTNVSSTTAATAFKFRSANNLLTVLVTDNDATHGDNLLMTINQANLVIAQSQVTGLSTTLATKLDKNTAITAGTGTKITYDADGLITSATTLVEADIPGLSASKITSGTFTSARLGSGTATEGYILKIVSGVPTWSVAPSGGTGSTLTWSTTDFAGAGTSGDPLRLAYGNGLPDPGSNGIIVRTNSNTVLPRTLMGEANRIVVANGSGVSGNPTFTIGTDIATLTGTQTFSGAKTFSVSPKISTLTSTGPRPAVINADGSIGVDTSDSNVWYQFNLTSSNSVGTTLGEISIPTNTFGMAEVKMRCYDFVENKVWVAGYFVRYRKQSSETSLYCLLNPPYGSESELSYQPTFSVFTSPEGKMRFTVISNGTKSFMWTIDVKLWPGNSAA